MKYDGMTALLNSERFSPYPPQGALSYLFGEGWRGLSNETYSDRYLLPQRTKWLNVDSLFEPEPIPSLPEFCKHDGHVGKAGYVGKEDYEKALKALQGGIDSHKLQRVITAEWAKWLNGDDLKVLRAWQWKKFLKGDAFEPEPIPSLPEFCKYVGHVGKAGYVGKEDYEKALKALREPIAAKRRSFEDIYDSEKVRLDDLRLRERYLNEEPETIAALIEVANRRHPIASQFRNGFRAFVDPHAKIVLIEMQFPDFAKHDFQIGTTATGIRKYASATQRKKIIRQCLCSVVIRAGYLASRILEPTSYKTIAINVSQDWFDPATGAPRIGIICSMQAQVSEFMALDLGKVDPEVCFRYLKGIAVPSFDSISPVRPIFVLNKNDERFIATKELDSFLAPESNLAAMPWEGFEQLVAQLFEWEFAKEGVEVRVTRVSRDRGVDAVLFDPDPLRGGKYVLQAKRYTSPVDVAAVRDLYGTVMNEGANRGILITTSSYGPDSYAFAKDKPISLVDGPNLLVMLRRHGKKFRIDLEEARRLNQESGDNV